MKPLKIKGYGSIAHLPISKLGQADKRVAPGQAVICLEKPRDRFDEIIVEEKLDGTCVAVANIDDELVALTRAGFTALSSRYEQHWLFDRWVKDNLQRFRFLEPGERVVGEWLAMVHGTKYCLKHEPFVAFDLMKGTYRFAYDIANERLKGFIRPKLIHRGPAFPLHRLIWSIDESGHGAESVEGAVYRVQRNGEMDFLAKFVRPDFVPGRYLSERTGEPSLWNWRPETI